MFASVTTLVCTSISSLYISIDLTNIMKFHSEIISPEKKNTIAKLTFLTEQLPENTVRNL